MKELNNNYKPTTLIENYKKILISITPIIPHFANECLDTIGQNNNIFWPTYSDKLIEEKEVNIVIQINGKKRSVIKVKKDIQEDELYKIVFSEEKILKYLDKKITKKKIYVKNRLINLII